MKNPIIVLTLSLLVSPLAIAAEMDHRMHTMPDGKSMQGKSHSTHNMPNGKTMQGKNHGTHNMPDGKAMQGKNHGTHNMPDGKTMQGKNHGTHNMPNGKTMQGMQHKATLPVSDGSLDHDVPFPYQAEKMEDDPVLAKFMLEQFEIRDANGDNPLTWEGEAWIGKDLNKLWLKTEGERVNGENEELEIQALYSRAIAPYWDMQIGVRKDFKPASREWGVVGLKGLAPYFFETDIALFAGDNGRTAARIQSEYELLLTQKTILTPEIEINLYGKNDPQMRRGSGLSNVAVGLRLRHEFRREFGPYIGVQWSKKFGNTADFARADGADVSDTQFVAGIRAWF